MAKKQKQGGNYEKYLETSNIKTSVVLWFILAIGVSLITAAVLFFAFPDNLSLAIMAALVLSVFIIGVPVIIKERRDTQIEDSIPDVFEEFATSLRAGATVEQALLDLTKIQSGPLIDEFRQALNDMEAGFSFEESLENIMVRIDILSLKRVFKIVIDGRKAGGELADILDAVADDARKIARIQRERKSKTLLYVIFIFAAGGVVAPIIFGFVTQIGELVVNIGGNTHNPNPLNIPGMSVNIFWIYLIIESFISGIMLAVVRGMRIWKGLIFYALPMAFIATIVFELSKLVASGLLPSSI